jgi:hypothetical protein
MLPYLSAGIRHIKQSSDKGYRTWLDYMCFMQRRTTWCKPVIIEIEDKWFLRLSPNYWCAISNFGLKHLIGISHSLLVVIELLTSTA